MGDKWKVCAVFSALATVMLSALGLALVSGYEYIPLKDVDAEDAGLTCFIAAGIYALLGACSAYISQRRPPRPTLVPASSQLLELRSTPHLEV